MKTAVYNCICVLYYTGIIYGSGASGNYVTQWFMFSLTPSLRKREWVFPHLKSIQEPWTISTSLKLYFAERSYSSSHLKTISMPRICASFEHFENRTVFLRAEFIMSITKLLKLFKLYILISLAELIQITFTD